MDCKKKHKDDIAFINKLIGFDYCQLIQNIGKWEKAITLEDNLINQNNCPVWDGYKRLDSI